MEEKQERKKTDAKDVLKLLALGLVVAPCLLLLMVVVPRSLWPLIVVVVIGAVGLLFNLKSSRD